MTPTLHRGLDRQPLLLACLWMCASLLSFVLMAVGARELADALPTIEILNLRSAVGCGVVAIILLRQGMRGLRTQHFGLHLLRNSAHFGGQFGWFYAIGFMPLAAVFAVEMTTPLWTALLAVVLLGEKCTLSRIIAIILGLIGIGIILQPGWSVMHPAAFGVLGCAVAYGLTHILTKKLSASDSPLGILAYMVSIQFALSLPFAIYHWITPDIRQWSWIGVLGVAGLSAHYCLIKALRLADATIVIPLDFLRLPLVAVVAWCLYDEAVESALLSGSALILAGLAINLYRERR